MTTQESQALQELKKAIGTESEPRVSAVEKGAIRKFAQAIGDPNPLYQDEAAARRSRYGGIIAPPTFLRSLEANPLPLESPHTRLLDGGSEWEHFHPVRPGDRITATQRLVDVFERTGRVGTMLLTVLELRYENQLGQLVATQRNTLIRY